MSRRRRSMTVLGVGTILAVTVAIGAALVGKAEYVRLIDRSLRNEAAVHGVRLTTRNLDIFPIGLRATEIEAFIVRALCSLTFGDVAVQLADLSPTFQFEGNAYGGRIEGTASKGWFSTALKGGVSAVGIDLARHPQLNALGVAGGTLTGQLQELHIDRAKPKTESSLFNVTIKGFTRPSPLTISPGQFGVPFGFTVPPIPPTDLAAAGSFEHSRLVLQRMTLQTELGTATASGEVPLSRDGNLTIEGVVSLSEVGSERLGAFLPLVSQGSVSADTTRIRVVARGTLANPTFRVSRAG